MQHTEIIEPKRSRGGRTSSPELRKSIKQSDEFEGLEENVKHFELLTLVKRAGKQAGFTSKMIELLEHYMILTRAVDWIEGSQPIVYKSQYQTAMDLGISDRHLQRLEKDLFKIGAITFNDSGNCKRYGQRDPKSGKIIYAYGVVLTPLALMKTELETLIQEQQLYKDAWMETKRQVSWHRGQIKSMLAEMAELSGEGRGAFESQYDEIAVRYTTTMSLVDFRSMLAKHQELYNLVLEALEALYSSSKDDTKTSKESCKTDSSVGHKQDTKNNQFNKLNTRSSSSNASKEGSNENLESKPQTSVQEDRYDTGNETNIILKTGIQHITLKQMLNVCGDDLKDYLPREARPMNINDFIEAAYQYKSKLFISQASWGRACQAIGREGATLSLILADRGVSRTENPVRNPAAYFNSMIIRAKAGDLHLHRSVFGHLKRENTENAANINSNSTQTTQNRKG